LFKQVPQQDNGCDCGYWTIHFGKVFTSNPTYFREHIGDTPYNIAECWRKEEGIATQTTLHEHVNAKLVKMKGMREGVNTGKDKGKGKGKQSK
jgi:Ulp1 family protease